MRELQAGGAVLPIRGGIVCRLYYYQQFGKEIEESLEEITKSRYERVKQKLLAVGASETDIEMLAGGDSSVYERLGLETIDFEAIVNYDDIRESALKVIWAMNKADRYAVGLSTPSYTQWLLNYRDKIEISAVIGDLRDEIFDTFHVSNSYTEGGERRGEVENISASVIAIGKRLGFSISEMNEMSVQSFLDVLHAYVGDSGDGGGVIREAVQGDIDALLM